jgi:putative DNA primase/helicase
VSAASVEAAAVSAHLSPDERRLAELVRAELHAETADNTAPISDDELARRFTDRHGDEFRYVASLGRWYRWTGGRWQHDGTMEVFDAARASCRLDLGYALAQGGSGSYARNLRAKLGSAATVAAVVKLASADRRHATSIESLDADPWLLNTPGGTLDLRSGTLRPHDRADLITKIAAATPTTECPTFLCVLERVLPDPEVRAYLQRLFGYVLTGALREHVVVIVYGSGGNGKSLVWNALRHALGDYVVVLDSAVLMESHNDRHPTEVAVLRGARLALASEVDSGRRWNESRLKRLSGGDPITARLIARDPFEFTPSHKLVLLANAKPGLRVVDEAIRRRIHLIEFAVTIPEAERDPDLPEKLKAEAGGILGWAVAGCLDWQDGGLRPPQAVLDATDRYLDREDSIAEWLAECCRPMGSESLANLHASFREFAEANALPPIGRNTFGDLLEARGIVRTEVRPRVWKFVGVSVAPRGGVRHAG